MKIASTIRRAGIVRRARRAGRKGIALVTVLTVMALTTILVLTFFSLANSERTASNTYSHGLQAQQIAEQAVNMAMAQIRRATVSEESGGSFYAWASQPGMIRTWEGRNFARGFKLYSDDQMIVVDESDLFTDFQEIASGWSERPDEFVDLNEPVIRGEKVYYPIVNPEASVTPQWRKPLGDDKNGVEGFRYNWGPLNQVSDAGRLGEKAAAVNKVPHLPMPVRWIYQLADGTLGTLDTGRRFQVLSGGGAPSEDNRIVARFAFWADDETGKLNINTHAGGLAWDTPRAGGDLDMDMAKYQPAQREWQRYPGHPATTHLIPALAPGVTDIVNDRDAMELIFKIVPRVVGGGSESGTRTIDTRDPNENNGLVADKDPLYPSVDEMIMRARDEDGKPGRDTSEFPDAKGDPLPERELSEYLERAKFFLTATSRAPETNMFNKPRVACWPVFNAPYGSGDYQERLTVFDKLIHYCASMGQASSGGYPRYDYIFKREQADSATYDAQIPRNAALYDYLLSLLGEDIPGYGISFIDKYGDAEVRQILTLIFDYIRSANVHDDTVYGEDFDRAFSDENDTSHLTYTNGRIDRDFNRGFGHKGHGQVTPSRIGDTKGMGRFFSLSGADIHVICAAEPGARHPMYPGVNGYRGYGQQDPDGRAWTNIPPWKRQDGDRGEQDDDDWQSQWPQWVKDLRESGDPEEYEAAFKPEYWNWQLAFLDGQYRSAVLANPTANKFRLGSLGGDTFNGRTRLQSGEKMVQAAFLFNLFSPSVGWNGINPNMEIHISRDSGMEFNGADGTFGFLGFQGNDAMGDADAYIWATNWIKPHREGGVRAWGGLLPFTYTFQARDVLAERGWGNREQVWWQLWDSRNTSSPHVRCRLTPLDRGYNEIESALGGVRRDVGQNSASDVAQAYRYDLVTEPFKVTDATGINFTGGSVTFEIYDGGDYCEQEAQDDDESTLVQTIEMEFDGFNFSTSEIAPAAGSTGWVNEFRNLGHDSTGPLERVSLTADPGNPWDSRENSAQKRGGSWANSNPADASRFDTGGQAMRGHNARGRMAEATIWWSARYIWGGDIVQSVAVPHGDMRLVAARPEISSSDGYFDHHRNYGSQKMAHSLTDALGRRMAGFNSDDAKEYLIIPTLGNNPYRNRNPLPFATERSSDVQLYGDFDNGAGTMIDGPYTNKPDEGNVHGLNTRKVQELVNHWEALRDYGDFPYFSNPEKAEAGGPSYFSPNRIMPGPGMFGSLPSGAVANEPWRTLLFRPNVRGNGYESHPGAENPPDHLLLDLFWMPVVEPYAISEPLSTAGKINLNYAMMPFNHIDRSTALRGVFRSEFVLCIPVEWHHSYKHDRGRGRGYHWRDDPYGGALQGKRLRSVIVEDDTLAQMRERFETGEIFKSATEICEIHLITEEVIERIGGGGNRGRIGTYKPTVSQMENGQFWRDHALVGDNSRERTYTNLQTRLTTKSNTFKVHYRAQVLQQARREEGGNYSTWNPETDTVQAEYRGSSVVERYVDPEDPDIPDYASAVGSAIPLDQFYKMRVLNPRRFAP